MMKSVVALVVVAVLCVVLSFAWNLWLESLRADNPQLSTSLVVRLVPVGVVLMG